MSIAENKLPILETFISAMWESTNDLLATDDGIGDSDISGLSSPGTVTQLRALIAALPFKERHRAKKDFLLSAFDDGVSPLFRMGAPTVTSATPSASGGSLADGAYKIKVTAFDRAGNETPAATELTATVSGGSGSGSIAVLIPANRGAVKYRVYYTTVGGAADSESRYKESGATAGITTGNVTVTLTTTTVSGSVVAGTPPTTTNATSPAGYGVIADIDVERGRAAGSDNFVTMMDLVAAQHPLGATALRNFVGSNNSATYNTAPTS